MIITIYTIMQLVIWLVEIMLCPKLGYRAEEWTETKIELKIEDIPPKLFKYQYTIVHGHKTHKRQKIPVNLTI